MSEQLYRWKNRQLREQAAVLDHKKSPTLVLKNARYLHSIFRKWMTANIWIYEDRIVYVGDKLPENLSNNCEVVDCSKWTLVPGYIEPHVHPFQLYNPQTFAEYASQTGTTTLITDNLKLAFLSEIKKAFSFINDCNNFPISMYWWCRFGSQTELENEEMIFTNESVKTWLEHDLVIQGGELTEWPKLLAGDDLILHWIQETKRLGKKIEGHFPGASEKTLAKMKLFGTDADHESMTAKDVYLRLMNGYTVALRHSSIRPDLPVLLTEMKEMGLDQYDSMFFTTDGSTPCFYEAGILDRMIRIALEHGVPTIDAYHMASYNVARYYDIQHHHGVIATGRIANINILEDETNPTPISVLSKGKWLKRDGERIDAFQPLDWKKYGLSPLSLRWDLNGEDLQFSMPFGVEMVNDVITKPYSVTMECNTEKLPLNNDESFFMLIDRNGAWRVNTMLKGFANKVLGFASSFTNTGDIIMIGKKKSDMILAFDRMKAIGGGIVLAENGEVIYELPLNLAGVMSELKMSELMREEERLKELLRERGYAFADPIHSLLFFSSTHLPYLRITQKGMYDVMNKTVLFPTIMR